MLYYETVFDEFYNPFYHYYLEKGNKKISIGYIPAGIDIYYRKQHLSTITMMNMLTKVSDKQAFFLKSYINIHPKDWYGKQGLNRKLMFHVQKQIALFSDVS